MDNDVIDDETKPVSDQLPDGIYLHLDEDVYHAQHRLSSSGIQKIMKSEADFWSTSWLNPDRVSTTTEAQLHGRASHTARLEPELLTDRFICQIVKEDFPGILANDTEVRAAIKEIQPQKGDYPDALKNDTDVKRALGEMGLPKTQTDETTEGRKDRLIAASAGVVFWDAILTEWENEHGPLDCSDCTTPLLRAQRLKSYGYEGFIWAIELDTFHSQLGDRTPLPKAMWDQIKKDIEEMRTQPIAIKYLTGGLAETSILWTDKASGVRMKCRIDYLKRDMFTDYKTFDNPSNKPLKDCIEAQFRYNKYYIQARVYQDGVDQIRVGELPLVGDFTQDELAIIDDIRGAEFTLPCTYVFQQKKGVPNLIACPVIMKRAHFSLTAAQTDDDERNQDIQFRYADDSLFASKAEKEIRDAIELFAVCMDEYGDGNKWRPLVSEIPITDDSFNGFWLDEAPENQGEVIL